MSKKKLSVAERAVKGVLGGWVHGSKHTFWSGKDTNFPGQMLGVVHIIVPAASVKKMLAQEKKAKKRK